MREYALNKLKEYVQGDKILRCEYISPTQNNCYCAVGFLLREAGVTDSELYNLSQDRAFVACYQDGAIEQKMLQRLDMNLLEMTLLQETNDRCTKEELLDVIERLTRKQTTVDTPMYFQARTVLTAHDAYDVL